MSFLNEFVPQVEKKSTQLNLAHWLLETTGSKDAAALQADLDIELRLLFSDPQKYQELKKWNPVDPLLKRQQNVLIRSFIPNQVPRPLLEEIATKEAALSLTYANYRPIFRGKELSDNGIRQILKDENDPPIRKEIWNLSKAGAKELAPQILALVNLRNQAAKSLGYADYFQMQLELQEVSGKWLEQIFEDLARRSDAAYCKMMELVETSLKERFGVTEIGPWAFAEPFCQEDPLDVSDLDSLVANEDILATSKAYYEKIGFDVSAILERSDNFERPGKNQHAFCIHIDRKGDVRTLNNVKPTIKWKETVLHELGHAVYEMGFDPKLPWLLREPPHMITTEAMALLEGRRAYLSNPKAEASLKRRQLIFSRWVLVMTEFEKALYRDPSQDLNTLWWKLVEKYQKIRPHESRVGKWDWAAKYHIGMAPVYYFSYLLGELFASSLEGMSTSDLKQKLFFPGNTLKWSDLIEKVTGSPLTPEAWLKQFCIS